MTGLSTRDAKAQPQTDAEIYAAWFGISRFNAVVLIALLNGPPQGRTVPRLARATDLGFETVRSALVRLREAMEPGALATDGLMHRLTEIGRDDCAKARQDAGGRS
jgi:hypothetical protein